MIDFGASTGSTEAGKALSPFIKELHTVFYQEPKKMNKTFFRTIEKFHIAFLVSGKNKDFESEGPEALQKVRGRNVFLIYYAIPEHRWKNVEEADLRRYLSEALKSCFLQLENKARSANEIIDITELNTEFLTRLERFTGGGDAI